MKPFLLNILCDPENAGGKLTYDQHEQKLYAKSGMYPVTKSGIPLMIRKDALQQPKKSDIHDKQSSNFFYLDHYKKDAEIYDYFQKRTGATLHAEKRTRQYIASKIPGNAKTLLDVGSGGAWVAQYFCRKGIQVVSLDVSLKNVEKALELYPGENHYGVVADGYSLPFADHSFDCVIASEVVEHVPEPKKFLESLFRVVRPGGALIITTPYKEKLRYTLCIHCNKLTPFDAHLHSFDRKKLGSFLREKEVKNRVTVRYGNKILIHLRTHLLLRFFPFWLWKITDKLFNGIYGAYSNVLVKWEK